MDVKKLPSIPPVGDRDYLTGATPPPGGGGQDGPFVHSVVDDYTRLTYSETLPDEKGTTVAAFTTRALTAFIDPPI